MTIKEILIKYSNDLENISDTPRLDVETVSYTHLENNYRLKSMDVIYTKILVK